MASARDEGIDDDTGTVRAPDRHGDRPAVETLIRARRIQAGKPDDHIEAAPVG